MILGGRVKIVVSNHLTCDRYIGNDEMPSLEMIAMVGGVGRNFVWNDVSECHHMSSS